jgi:hypothetical protein
VLEDSYAARFGQNPSGQKTEKRKTQKGEAAGFGEGQKWVRADHDQEVLPQQGVPQGVKETVVGWPDKGKCEGSSKEGWQKVL